MVWCSALACLLAVLAVMPQLASGQVNSNYSTFDSSQWKQSRNNSQLNTSWSCAMWYNHLEEALVADEEIIHHLQDTFFPVSGRAPFFILVSYDIQYLSNGTAENKSLRQGWSSSAVLSVIHPALILHWQPWLDAVFLLQGMIKYEIVNISLSIVEDVGKSASGPQLECAVWKLTSWLRAYAEYRGKPQRWEERNKGFIGQWNGSRNFLVMFATLATQIWLQLNLMKLLLKTVPWILEQETMWSLCVWSAGDVFLILNLIPLAADVVTLIAIGSMGSVRFTLLNVGSFLIVPVSSVIWAVVGWRKAHKFPPDLWPVSQRKRYFCLFLSYAMCANIVARFAVPTLLLVMVFPLEGISATGLVCLLFVVLVMFPLLLRSQLKDCFFFCNLLVFLIVIAFVVAVYVSVLFTGSGTNEYFQAFIPALGSAVVAYWVKKTFFDKNKRSKD